MTAFDEAGISKAIASAYHEKLLEAMHPQVLIAGAGPAGLVAASLLAERGVTVTVVEKRLATGGGIWGGALGMNELVVQQDAREVLELFEIRLDRQREGLYVVDATELACALALRAVRAGAIVLNLMTVEDACVRDSRVTGLVVNRTMISGALPVDPLAFPSTAVLDATGHDAVVLQALRRRGLASAADGTATGEGPLDAPAGERFVVDRVGEPYPGLWVAGMSVCTTYGGPRMGPIFGGMLLSGKRAAERIAAVL
jgi:sulfide-dependent adenosine diphosphate thiazole synthase